MQTSFALHQLAHTHWLKLYGTLLDPHSASARGRQDAQREGGGTVEDESVLR